MNKHDTISIFQKSKTRRPQRSTTLSHLSTLSQQVNLHGLMGTVAPFLPTVTCAPQWDKLKYLCRPKWRNSCPTPCFLLCDIWEALHRKQVSRARTNDYIPQYLWDVITCPCPWYLLPVQRFSYHSAPMPWIRIFRKHIFKPHMSRHRSSISAHPIICPTIITFGHTRSTPAALEIQCQINASLSTSYKEDFGGAYCI